MTKIFTIGSNGKSPKNFFNILKENNVQILLDIRLNNTSQLAGFAKGGNDFLGYLLKEICDIDYEHVPLFAPTSKILDQYKKDNDWGGYVNEFSKLITQREMKKFFDFNFKDKYNSICLLCAEEEATKCHRRLVAEAFLDGDVEIIHL